MIDIGFFRTITKKEAVTIDINLILTSKGFMNCECAKTLDIICNRLKQLKIPHSINRAIMAICIEKR